MSLLKSVEVKDAHGSVAKIYDEITQEWGGVPNPLKLMSLNPDALENLWHKLNYQTKLNSPSQKMLSMVRLLVSSESNCEYCVGHNSNMLINRFGLSVKEVITLKKDPSSAQLDKKEKALLLFVLKSVFSANSVTSNDVENLRTLGVSDKEMLDSVNAGVTNLSVDILINTFKLEVDY